LGAAARKLGRVVEEEEEEEEPEIKLLTPTIYSQL
jgi:hypothetical protein